ncbi:hypothetical protein, partial [Pseudacidovorax intermedius]|uniref:hypothetical protein n=1 Tax=Pseudacidovorax intermedius TaxID=433924 RepID=UPI0005B8A9CF
MNMRHDPRRAARRAAPLGLALVLAAGGGLAAAQPVAWDPTKGNLGIGDGAGTSGVTGSNNQAIGKGAGNGVGTNWNLAIGEAAGTNVSGGNANVAIGFNAG